MGTLWRSEYMQLVQIFVQIEAARDTVDELGKLGCIQFRDLKSDVNPFQRNFVNEVRQAEEMERKLRFLEAEIQRELRTRLNPLPAIDLDNPSMTDTINMGELENRLDQLEADIRQYNTNQDQLTKNYNSLVELRHALAEDTSFFSAQQPLQGDAETGEGVHLGFTTGVIPRANLVTFERVLWRATRGNIYLRSTEIPDDIRDPNTKALVAKNVFIVWYQGTRAQAKIKRICESFGASLYDVPDTLDRRRQLGLEVQEKLVEVQAVLEKTSEHKRQVLRDVDAELNLWKAKVLKEKSIYHVMNMFNYDIGRKCLIAEGWCPSMSTEQIQLALRRATTSSNTMVPSILSVIPAKEDPPTHFTTNYFTNAYQEIVNAYGIPHYREINPAVFTLVTFPFLFGLMFGDVGHGTIIFLIALFFIVKEKDLSKQAMQELVQFPFDGRYVIISMSLAAIYMGALYNECFSIPVDFGSRFEICANTNATNMCLKPQYINHTTDVYPFGIDPAWKGAPNELDLYNSVKMKFSIVVGVLQMSMGILMYGWNNLNRRNWLAIFFEFIPMVVFMEGIFGYMSFIIIWKWAVPGLGQVQLLQTMIYMFLSPFAEITEASGQKLFEGQRELQIGLLIAALTAVPIMLIPKPIIMKCRASAKAKEHHYEIHPEEDEEEPFEFGEVFIHQVIHTIEFTLGSVSNTASYLRLWALSLAHSELSGVFWSKTIFTIITSYPAEGESSSLPGARYVLFLYLFIAFYVWSAATFAVLIVMEALSAFLHGLRLHWVEFQNKFYAGDGRRFVPYSYAKILAHGTLEELINSTAAP